MVGSDANMAADRRRGIITRRKPRLSEIPLFKIVRRPRTTHFRGDPAGIAGIAQHVGPASRDHKRECRQIQLAVRICLAGVPASLASIDVSQ